MIKENKKQIYILFIILLVASFSGVIILKYVSITGLVTLGAYKNYDTGYMNDSFTDNTSLSSKSNVDVNGTIEQLQLKNASGQFSPPYNTSGFVITNTLMPVSVVQWLYFNFTANTSQNTSVKIQVLDEVNYTFPDRILPGNTNGFATSPIDLRNLSVLDYADPSSTAKIARLRFKIILETNDTNITPTVDSIHFNWKVRADTLPEPSPLANVSWPKNSINSKSTMHTAYYNDKNYSVIKWATSEFVTDFSASNNLLLNDILIFSTWVNYSNLYAINKTTKQIIWQMPYYSSGLGRITSNGNFYASEMVNDIFLAIDILTGQLKWTYNFTGGHGNSDVAISNDGILYTIRYSTGTGKFTLYTFYSNGSFRSSNDIIFSATAAQPQFSGITIGDNDTLYVASYFLDSNYGPLPSQFYAINLTNSSVIWNYTTTSPLTTYVPPMIDSSGIIYTSSKVWSNSTIQKEFYAFYPNGTLKWERNIGSESFGWSYYTLLSDGNIVAIKSPVEYTGLYFLEKINSSNGSLISSKEINLSDGSLLFSDGQDNLYTTTSDNSFINSFINKWDIKALLNKYRF